MVQNKTIAWRSVTDSVFRNSGRCTFSTHPDGSTRVDIQLSYFPPAGFLGHVAAKLFGADPKSRMDHDLVALKSALERGEHRRPFASRFGAALEG